MKSFILIIIVFVLYSANAFCMNSELIISSKSAEINSGEFNEIIIRLWPTENVNLDELKKIEGQTLFGGLYISEIQSLSPSENNAEVFEIKAIGVVTGEINPSKLYFNYLGHEIPVKFQDQKIKFTENKNKDFYILDQSLDLKLKTWIIISLIIILLFCIMVLFRKKIGDIFKTKKTQDPREDFKTLFLNAKSREDFERIYSEKENWIPLLTVKTQAHSDFFDTINQYQYKKNWSHEEQVDVETSFDNIRRSFE